MRDEEHGLEPLGQWQQRLGEDRTGLERGLAPAVAAVMQPAFTHAVITVLGICKLGHKEAYGDMFMVGIVGPMIALVRVVILATFLGGF